MNAAQLEHEFRSRGIDYRGGLLLLAPDDAVALIRRAEAERVAILGVDGMFVTPDSTMSPLEHIANFSSAVARGHGCWQEAIAFVEERRRLGMVFEVVLDCPTPPVQ